MRMMADPLPSGKTQVGVFAEGSFPRGGKAVGLYAVPTIEHGLGRRVTLGASLAALGGSAFAKWSFYSEPRAACALALRGLGTYHVLQPTGIVVGDANVLCTVHADDASFTLSAGGIVSYGRAMPFPPVDVDPGGGGAYPRVDGGGGRASFMIEGPVSPSASLTIEGGLAVLAHGRPAADDDGKRAFAWAFLSSGMRFRF